jgi:hypothetical protein
MKYAKYKKRITQTGKIKNEALKQKKNSMKL